MTFGNQEHRSETLATETRGDETERVGDGDLELLDDSPAVAPSLAHEQRRVVLRVQGGEDIVLGRAEGRDAAVQIAREMIHTVEAATARGEWPQIEDRFVRPGAIVSVDVQRPE